MKTIIILTSLLITSVLSAQQIGDGRALEITDFSAPLKSGVYQGSLPIGKNPDTQVYGWQHLFVIRHSNDANNHQLQLSSSYTMNDRLFFRKIAGGFEPNNPTWIELATRGTNTFNGNQNLIGNQTLTGNFIIGQDGEISTIAGPASSGAIQIKTNSYAGGSSNRYLRLGWKDNNATFSPALSINDDLNVGIGTTNPTSKLTVAGNINSREVKVTVDAGADFVFENNYNLPSLDTVDKYIKKNRHLPEIASADEMKRDGINLSEMNIKLLQKIEELTLYIIEIKKENNQQYLEIEKSRNEIGILNTENESMKKILERLSKIEEKLKVNSDKKNF